MTENGADAAADAYGRFARPMLMRLLKACRLDRIYHRADGNRLWTKDSADAEVEILDMVGGFGVGLLGHNHPKLVDVIQTSLKAGVPFHAQGSLRASAGLLCKRLSELVGESTGRRYIVTLANTGTEAVEAALKHAELERDAKVTAILDGYREHYRSIQEKLRNRECDLVPRILNRVGERLGLPPGSDPDLDEIHHYILRHNLALAEAEPLYLALEGAFHGKTTGSVKLTYDHEVRYPFRRIGLRVRFLPVGDVVALERAIAEEALTYLDLSIGSDGAVRLEEKPFTNIAAMLVEPIQGEGGIREVPTVYLQRARQAADSAGFPLVIDEIQTGCGRTGTFLASETRVVGDYYVLSKALGGGLAKVSAMLVDSARYREKFGSVHTSTFAEDDLSSRIALAVLDLVSEAKYGVQDRVLAQGERLRSGLRGIQARYPKVLADVRGRGLMTGIEFVRLEDSDSPTIRLIASQGFLGFCLAGHLLFESRIRVLPTLSHPETLRLQPSAFITDEQIDTFLEAVDHVCAILERDRGDQLIGFLCADEGVRFAKAEETVKGSTSARSARIARIRPTRPQRASVIPPYAGRVAFLGHFIRPGHLRHWDPGLGDFDDDALARFVDRTHRLLEPYVSDGAIIESVVGERVHMSFIGIPITPMQIHRAFENGNIRWVEEKILEGVRLGRRQGASLVGMGGYTSILTGQGTRVSEDRVGITSGNAMTVAMGVEALIRTAKDVKIDLSTARLGALGATGNICSLYAQMMAELVPKIALIGRPHMESRLRRVAGEVYFETYKVVRRAGDKKLRGLAKVLQGTETFKQVLSAEADLDRIGTSIYNWISNEMGDDAPITIHSDPSGLKDCNLIVAASSFPGPVIFPQHLGPGPRVICDLALPEDTSPEVLAQRPDVKVIRGGIVKLPNNPDLELAGVPLEPGCVFACMAETLLLGLSRINEHFSWGRVTKPHVEAIRDLATYHGFTLSRPSMTSVL